MLEECWLEMQIKTRFFRKDALNLSVAMKYLHLERG